MVSRHPRTSPEKMAYYAASATRETRVELEQAVALVEGPRIAIDCGCGAGSDIAFLIENGFTVHAFDIEQYAIARCRERFAGDARVILTRQSFEDFSYPRASLIVADASLFFCPRPKFASVWQKIREALLPGGIFTGSFVGPEDTMAGADYDVAAFWPDVLVTDEAAIRGWVEGLELIALSEHRSSGKTPAGDRHDWHVFSVVARKPGEN